MTSAVPDILARIAEHKRRELDGLELDIRRLEREAELVSRRDFKAALSTTTPAIIAEIKRASPSKGLLDPEFDPARRAVLYEQGGAAALSVLTDSRFFQGSLEDLRRARSEVALPVLRKDFTIHLAQIAEAAAAGADAVLLIAALLSTAELREFRSYAESLGLAALVEVHDRPELDRAIGSGAGIIGVNNRDLRTFEVSLGTSLELAAAMPSGTVLVSESGINSRAAVSQLSAAGYHAFLIGEHLMKSADPSLSIRELRG